MTCPPHCLHLDEMEERRVCCGRCGYSEEVTDE
jgi:hypothetical protein